MLYKLFVADVLYSLRQTIIMNLIYRAILCSSIQWLYFTAQSWNKSLEVAAQNVSDECNPTKERGENFYFNTTKLSNNFVEVAEQILEEWFSNQQVQNMYIIIFYLTDLTASYKVVKINRPILWARTKDSCLDFVDNDGKQD